MSLFKKCLIEGLGSSLIVLLSTGFFEFLRNNFPALQLIAPFTCAILIVVLVYIAYNITGAHFNPIINLAVYLNSLTKPKENREFGTKEFLFYLLAQLLGAFLGTIITLICFGINSISPGEVMAPFTDLSYYQLRAFAIEILLGAIYVFNYLMIRKMNNKTISKAFTMGFVALIVLLVGSFIGKTTINPFGAITSAFIDLVYGNTNSVVISQLWIFTIGPLLGSLIAFSLFSLFYNFKKFKDVNEEKLTNYIVKPYRTALFFGNINYGLAPENTIPMLSYISTSSTCDNEISSISPLEDDSQNEAITTPKETLLARANQTFEERLQNLDSDILAKYQSLRDYCLSYGLRERNDNEYNIFHLNKTRYIIFTIRGKAIKIYFALDPADYKDSTISFQDGSSIAKYKDVPLIFKVKSDLSFKRALLLIDDTMEKANIQKPK